MASARLARRLSMRTLFVNAYAEIVMSDMLSKPGGTLGSMSRMGRDTGSSRASTSMKGPLPPSAAATIRFTICDTRQKRRQPTFAKVVQCVAQPSCGCAWAFR